MHFHVCRLRTDLVAFDVAQMLYERSAMEYIEELQPAADPKDWNVAV